MQGRGCTAPSTPQRQTPGSSQPEEGVLSECVCDSTLGDGCPRGLTLREHLDGLVQGRGHQTGSVDTESHTSNSRRVSLQGRQRLPLGRVEHAAQEKKGTSNQTQQPARHDTIMMHDGWPDGWSNTPQPPWTTSARQVGATRWNATHPMMESPPTAR